MSNLKILPNIKGSIAAIEFSNDGKATAKQGNIDDNTASLIADMCSANIRLGSMQANYFSAYSGIKGFDKLEGFAISGPGISLCVWNNIALLVENSQADFNEVFETLPKSIA
jgi:roadblock/LC7 domain-containing protein